MSKTLYKNTSYLVIVQFVIMLIPLSVIPYLTRNLSLDEFGKTMLMLSISAFLLIITDFGFNISGTYKVSVKRAFKHKLERLLSAIFLIKFFLIIVIVSLIFLSYFLSFIGFKDSCYISLLVLSQSLSPVWFLQGVEKMKDILIITLLSRLIYLSLVFSDGNISYDDVIVYTLIMNSLLTIFLYFKIFVLGYRISSFNSRYCLLVFKDSLSFFYSRLAVSLYTRLNTIILGTFSNTTQVAFFTSNEKIYTASQSISSPVSRALFPFMANKGSFLVFYKMISAILVVGLLVAGMMFFYSKEIVVFVFGPEFISSVSVFEIFILISVITFVSMNFGYPVFSRLGKIEYANKSVLYGAFIQLMSIAFLIFNELIDAYHLVIALLITETFVLLYRIYFFKKLTRNNYE
ncbi:MULTISPECIES: oligosaccharide flippase family protein [Vibrio harveyi group]|uniref:oligosaccharide flippase family protein n=1 Tax=Vibrio harveyi group TaxID=717610 RepID=UPI000998A794|nr:MULTISPECIES: oligosaccharide flippase family protein [Vibrio harveyi group]EGQ8795788.1 oligosaccharide flippase family protein [Vibrio parahaemolyticus]EGU8226335.1 oligosaccharide flippase family protein [Vibrio parahaemolyticus]EHU0318280.1 oligosaccharide flippase family protein [Vibrio parahaemolyticus]EJC7058675.1 oligosaccharide flippase family protein [Vibrio parahaemolyticus]OQU27245.1 hypothetical protein EM47_004265 [Vibrio parahaemolyticus]